MNKTHVYVVGLVFNADLSQVLLIRKLKPAWQAGLLNGVGGKVEQDEHPEDAMTREFKEEAGAALFNWNYFARMAGDVVPSADHFIVHCYAFCYPEEHLSFDSQEEEKLECWPVANIGVKEPGMVENLPWLIGLAIDHLEDRRPSFTQINYPLNS